MLPLALEFPDAIVGLATQLPDPVRQALDHVPELGRDEAALSLIHGHAVDYRPENIELLLAGRAVADANGSRAFVARQGLEVLLRQVRVAIHPIEDL